MHVKCVRGHTFRCRHRSQALRPFPRGPVVSSIKAIRLDSDPVTGEALEVPMGRNGELLLEVGVRRCSSPLNHHPILTVSSLLQS